DRIKQANATVRTLDYLTKKGFVTKKQAALMLMKYAADGERAKALSNLSLEAKSNPTYKYYEGYTHLTNLRQALTSGRLESIQKGDRKGLNLLKSLIGELVTEAGTRADYEELFRDHPEAKQEILTALKAINGGSSSPNELRQLLGNKVTKTLGYITPEAKEAIKRRLDARAETIDLKGTMELIDNDPNKVVIRLGSASSILDSNLKTAAERDIIRIALNHEILSVDARKVVESDDNGIIPLDVKIRLARELSAKSKYIEAANGRGYIIFDKNSDEFKKFAKDLGYTSTSYLLKQQGVINYMSNPIVVKVDMTKKHKQILDKAEAKVIDIETIDTKSFQKELGKNNSKGLAYINDNTVFNLEKIMPILTTNHKILEDIEAEGTQSKETTVKASVSAGQAKDKLLQTNLTSKVLEGFEDTQMSKALFNRDLLEALLRIEAKKALIVPKELQAAYLEKMGLNPNYRGEKLIKEYFKDTIWDVTVKKDSWEFNIRPDILEARIEQFINGELEDQDIFKYIPLIVSKTQRVGEAGGYLNKTGEQLFTVKAVPNQTKQLVNVMNTFATNWRADLDSRLDILKALESNSAIGNLEFSFSTEGIKIPKSATLSELEEVAKDLLKSHPNNIYVKSLQRMIEIARLTAEETNRVFRDPTVAIMVTDARFNETIVTMHNNGSSEADIIKALQKINEPIKKQEGTINIAEDKSAYETIDGATNQIATRTVIEKFNVRNNLPENISDVQVREAIKILSEGADSFRTNNRSYKEVDPGISNLQVFQKDNSLYIPVDKLPFLSKQEEDFILDSMATKEAQEEFKSRVKYFKEEIFEMPKDFNLKVDSVVQTLLHPESPSAKLGGIGTENIKQLGINKEENMRILKAIKDFLFNSYTNSRLGDNLQNVDEGSLGQKLNKLLINELITTASPNAINVYNLDSVAGTRTMITHIAETYDALKNQMFGGIPQITEEISDNLVDTAFTIVANNKGGYHWNEYKNAFLIDENGAIVRDSVSGHYDLDFNRMMLYTDPKDLKGKKLLIPKEDTFEGIVKPQFELIDMNDDNITKLRNNAILKAVESSDVRGIKIDEASPEEIVIAIEDAYARPITLRDRYQSIERTLLDTGLSKDVVSKVFHDSLDEIANRFSDTSPNKVLELNDIFSTKNLAESHRKKADSFAYGVNLSKEEITKHDNITKALNKNTKLDTEIEGLNSKDVSKLNTALGNYIRELFKDTINPRENLTTTKVDSAKDNAIKAIKEFIATIDSNPEIVDKNKAKATVLSEQLVKAYLTNNDEGYVLKFLTDESSDMLNMETKQYRVDTEGTKTIFDTETFNGKVFQASVTKGS
ncbi:MAG: hypothetical protein ACOX8T_12310, partial [Bacillota bacterium]